MVFLFAVALGWAIGTTYVSCCLWSARQRTYRYAVSRCDEFDRVWLAAGDEPDDAGRHAFGKSCAYSDMATVIVLDGKVPVKRDA